MLRPRLLALLLALPLGLAGCLTSAAEPEVEPQVTPLPATAAEIPVLIEGSLGVVVLTCPVVTCVGRTVVGTTERIFEQDVQGDLERINLTLTWDASSAVTRNLRLGVFTCGGECKGDSELSAIEYVDGPSPLVLDLAGFSVGEGETLSVFVWVPSMTPSPTYAVVTTPQAFHVEGSFVPAGAGGAGQAPASEMRIGRSSA